MAGLLIWYALVSTNDRRDRTGDRKDPVWVVDALLAQHALTAADSEIVGI